MLVNIKARRQRRLLSPYWCGSDVALIWISRRDIATRAEAEQLINCPWFLCCNGKFVHPIWTWPETGKKKKKMVVRCACFLWLPPHTPSCFSFLSTDMFWLPLFSWQLWVPTISSHTAYHLLHFTDCGCSKAKFTPQPYKPTLLFSVSGDSSCSAAPALFFLTYTWGPQTSCGCLGLSLNMRWNDAVTLKQSGAAQTQNLMFHVLSFQCNFCCWIAQWKTIIHIQACTSAYMHHWTRACGALKPIWVVFFFS